MRKILVKVPRKKEDRRKSEYKRVIFESQTGNNLKANEINKLDENEKIKDKSNE